MLFDGVLSTLVEHMLWDGLDWIVSLEYRLEEEERRRSPRGCMTRLKERHKINPHVPVCCGFHIWSVNAATGKNVG